MVKDRSNLVCVILFLAPLAITPLSSGGDKPAKEPVQVTAVASKIDAGKQTVTVTISLEPGWIVYANPINNASLASFETRIKLVAKTPLIDSKIQYPRGKVIEEDPPIGNYAVYEGKVEITANITRAEGDSDPLEVEVFLLPFNLTFLICQTPRSYRFTLR